MPRGGGERCIATALAGLVLVFALPPPGPTGAADARDRALLQEGWRRYQGVCGHCHGPDGAGSSFAPGLIAPLADRDRFDAVTLGGVSGQRGVMRGFAGDPNVAPYVDAIYAYLAERAAGRLGRGRP